MSASTAAGLVDARLAFALAVAAFVVGCGDAANAGAARDAPPTPGAKAALVERHREFDPGAPKAGTVPSGPGPGPVPEPKQDGKTLTQWLDALGPEDAPYFDIVEKIVAMGEPAAARVLALFATLPEDDLRLPGVIKATRGLVCDAAALEPVLKLASGADLVARHRALDLLAHAAWDCDGRDVMIVQNLAPLLHCADAQTKCLALKSLGKSLLPADTAAEVIALFGDGDPEVRAAVVAVGETDAPGWDALVLRAFADSSPVVRTAACESRRLQSNSPEMQQLLVVALKDDVDGVRCAAAYALEDSASGHDEPVVTALVRAVDDPSVDVRRRALFALVKIERGAAVPIDRLIAILNDPSETARPAIEAVAQWKSDGAKALPALLPLLESEDKFDRDAAAKALHAVAPGDDAAEPALAKLLHDPEQFVRATAMEALQPYKLRAMDAFAVALADSDESIRDNAVKALGSLYDRATPKLVGLLLDPEPLRRAGALRALEQTSSEEAVFHASEMLTDTSPVVRTAAANALSDAPDDAVRPIKALCDRLSDADAGVRSAVVDALASVASPSDDVRGLMRARLRDADPGVRFTTARVLIEREPAAAVPVLSALLADEKMKWLAIDELSEAAATCRPAFDAVVAALQGPSDCVRRKAAEGLGELKEKAASAVPALVALLTGDLPPGARCPDGECFPRSAAARALHEIAPDDPKVKAALEAAAKSDDKDLRETVRGILGMNDADATGK